MSRSAATPAPLPAGACDTHIHFYNAGHPTAPTALITPPEAWVENYRALQARLGLSRVVVVQPTTYGLDNACQLQAMAAFGDNARGVVVVDSSVTEATLERYHALGVRGVRFHMLPGGALDWRELAPAAARIRDYGWHLQLQMNGRELPARLPALQALPVELVVDHLGRFMPPVGVDHPAFKALLKLLDTGRCWVKLSAPYESSRSGPPDYADVSPLARALVRHAPDRMLWASNWPHPGQAAPPDEARLLALLEAWAGDARACRRILVDNPAELYGFA